MQQGNFIIMASKHFLSGFWQIQRLTNVYKRPRMATRRTAVGKWYEGQKGSEISQETSATCNTIKSGHPPNQFVTPVTGTGAAVAAKWDTIVMRIQ